MEDLKILRRYHSILRPYLAVFVVSIVLDIAMTLLGLSAPLFSRVLFDFAFAFRDLHLLNITILAIVAVYFLHFFIGVASDYLQLYVSQDSAASLTKKVFGTIARLPVSFHQEKKCGDLMIRLTDDVGNTVALVANILPTVIIDGGKFLVILAIALHINPQLTLLALLSVPLYILETKFYAKRRAHVAEEAINADSDILSRAQERLGNIKTVKAFGQEDAETASFGTLIRRRFGVAIKGKFLEIVQTFTNSMTLQMWAVFLTWYLGYGIVRGTLTIGEVVALLMYFEQLGDPIRSFIGLFTDWKTSLVSMRRLDEVILAPQEGQGRPEGSGIKIRDGEVTTEHISFSYAGDEDVLHDIEVKFPPRSLTAIVGASGGGKTTLINLLLRFFDPTHGIILIDGQNISEAKICELRNKIGIVAQDATLFDGTIMDNLLYGNEGRNRGDAIQAARLSGADSFIEKMPGGYDTQVGAGGCLLSAGQRQRISIARTLLRNPAIMIFDEATSALDAESEFKIHETVAKLRQTKTVIVIAHRLSTIKSADNIMVLEGGRFVEEGRFEELLEKKQAFYRFYWRQFGGLASFCQRLHVEMERLARYGSKFCCALAKVKNFQDIEAETDAEAAENFMESLDFMFRKRIRAGDDCARMGEDMILFILPEIEASQMEQFFARMMKEINASSEKETGRALSDKDVLFVGTRLTKKRFKTPEDLIMALKEQALKAGDKHSGNIVLDEEQLI